MQNWPTPKEWQGMLGELAPLLVAEAHQDIQRLSQGESPH